VIVIFGFGAMGVFFAWGKKKTVITIIALTLGIFGFLSIAFC